MSTRLTRKSPAAGFELVDSLSLSLTMGMRGFLDRVTDWMIKQLASEGFAVLSPTQLSFVASLDCGVNHAADVARRLSVSRQAVHKIVRELEGVGLLATRPDEERGNRKVIVFTAEGERMMAVARRRFADLDRSLMAHVDKTALQALQHALSFNPDG